MLDAFEIDIPDFSDFFADLPLPRARRRGSKSKLRDRRLGKRTAVMHALAAGQTGSGRAIARALFRELRHAAARASRPADSDARTLLLRRFAVLNARKRLSEGVTRGVFVKAPLTCSGS